MIPSPLVEPVHRVASAWRQATDAPLRRLAFAVLAVVWSLGLLAARAGTGRARVFAFGAMAASAVGAIVWLVRDRRRLDDPA
ncbi:MAG: hypothetical protein ACRENE_18815, partial [Polyangiaceae bacterium]